MRPVYGAMSPLLFLAFEIAFRLGWKGDMDFVLSLWFNNASKMSQ